MTDRYDAVVVGAGPNGLAGATTLALAGLQVLVVEAHDTVGGGARTAELGLPGFRHDLCSAVHPFGAASPFLARLPLEDHGLRWIHPPVPLAHPLDGGRAAVLDRDLDRTAEGLGADGAAWRATFGPLVESWDGLTRDLLGPLLRVPRHPVSLTRFGVQALLPARAYARWRFDGELARALFAGSSAHAIQPLTRPATASLGLMLTASAHAVGWPVAEGGSQAIADALTAYLQVLGGEVRTGWRVTDLAELPAAPIVLLDLTPAQLLAVAGDRLPPRAQARARRWRYGPAAFKVDYALSGPVPWTAGACRRAGTVHVGGTLDEITAAERIVADGRVAPRPFVLVAQQSVADATRAPDGQHTLWTYAHVPNGCPEDVTPALEAQIERFAPGFRDLVLERHVRGPAQLEAYNPNYVGGDIAGGAQDPVQLALRMARPLPYRTAVPGVYVCSASTAPGAGVHGMCGHHAARAALRDLHGRRQTAAAT